MFNLYLNGHVWGCLNTVIIKINVGELTKAKIVAFSGTTRRGLIKQLDD